MGTVSTIEEVQPPGDIDNMMSTTANQLVTNDELKGRKQKLASLLTVGDTGLQKTLLEYHHLFSLE